MSTIPKANTGSNPVLTTKFKLMKKRYPFITAAEAIVFSLVLSFLFVVLLLTLFVEIAK